MTTVSGTITKGIAGFYYVHDGRDKVYECKAKGIFRNLGTKPVPGDRVEIEVIDSKEKLGNIVRINNRKNTLIRPSAANIDQAILTFAVMNPLPSCNLIDRLLVYYRMLHIPVVIAFGKVDLDDGTLIERYRQIYDKSDVKLVFFSTVETRGLDSLMDLMAGKTSVITGPSGVGKSTLINALVPGASMEVGELSTKLRSGKNTTRHTELFCAFENSFILDTPGFTSFILDGLEAFELKDFYPEFDEYNGKCRFNDCVHIGEIDCAVRNAVNDGSINAVRYDNYKSIYTELKEIKKY